MSVVCSRALVVLPLLPNYAGMALEGAASHRPVEGAVHVAIWCQVVIHQGHRRRELPDPGPGKILELNEPENEFNNQTLGQK